MSQTSFRETEKENIIVNNLVRRKYMTNGFDHKNQLLDGFKGMYKSKGIPLTTTIPMTLETIDSVICKTLEEKHCAKSVVCFSEIELKDFMRELIDTLKQ